MTNAFEAVIFDFDGTLFDTRKNIAAAVNKTREEFQADPLALETVVSFIGHGALYLAEHAFSDINKPFEKVYQRYREIYREHALENIEIYSGVKSTLKKISIPCHIVSNKPEENMLPLLTMYGIDHYFDFKIGADTLKWRKPAKEIGDHILRERGYRAENVLMVGDFNADIEFARNCGMKSAFCHYGFLGEDPLGADYHLSTFRDLEAILL